MSSKNNVISDVIEIHEKTTCLDSMLSLNIPTPDGDDESWIRLKKV